MNPSEPATLPVHQISFGLKDKIGYMLGDVGNCFIAGMTTTFLMVYYTNIMGLSAGVVGTMFFVGTLIDAVADIVIGRILDVIKPTGEGRFRPWIRRMKWPMCFIPVLLLLPVVKGCALPIRYIYAFVTFILFGVIFAGITIPYGSLSSAMSHNPDERASLSIYRSVGASVGSGSTGFILPLIVYTQTTGGQKILSESRLFWSAVVCSILAFISYSILYYWTKERVDTSKQTPVKLKISLRSMLRDRSLVALIFADMMVCASLSVSGSIMTYLFSNYFNSNLALSVALLFTYGTTLVLAPIAKWLNTRFGKKEASSVALILSAILYLGMLFMHLHNPWIYLIFLFIATLGTAMFNLMIWAFITDVNDNHQYVTGNREDGTIYGVNFFGRKVAQALAGGLSGVLLELIGYQSSVNGGRVQTLAVNNNIYFIANLVPGILLLIAGLILALWYPLTKTRINKIGDELQKGEDKKRSINRQSPIV